MRHVHPPDSQEAGIDSKGPAVATSDALVLITVVESRKLESDPLGGGLLRSSLENAPILVSVPPPTWLNLEALDDQLVDSAAPAAIEGDPAERAHMFGRYTGQIRARIEGAWMIPHSPASVSEVASRGGASAVQDAPPFRCDVQIRQDSQRANLFSGDPE